MIQSARDVNPSIHVFYHSDGTIEEVIPDLIEIGVNVLNPVQPECMDPVKLKRQYGKNLAFWGTVGTQTTFPFGTPEEVKRVVKERIETVGNGGTYGSSLEQGPYTINTPQGKVRVNKITKARYE